MFRKKKKEPKIELCELWSLNHTLAKIISRYLKEFIEASSLSGSTPGIYYQKDPENCWNLWEADLWKKQKAFEDYAVIEYSAEFLEGNNPFDFSPADVRMPINHSFILPSKSI